MKFDLRIAPFPHSPHPAFNSTPPFGRLISLMTTTPNAHAPALAKCIPPPSPHKSYTRHSLYSQCVHGDKQIRVIKLKIAGKKVDRTGYMRVSGDVDTLCTRLTRMKYNETCMSMLHVKLSIPTRGRGLQPPHLYNPMITTIQEILPGNVGDMRARADSISRGSHQMDRVAALSVRPSFKG